VFSRVSTEASRPDFSSWSTGKSEALPLQFGVAEVEDQSQRESSDPQIVYHLASLMIGDSIDHLCVDDDLLRCDQIRNILAYFNRFIDYIETRLLSAPYLAQSELDTKAFSYGFS
jgi:hypothetical protein